jgi:hypothetical protein
VKTALALAVALAVALALALFIRALVYAVVDALRLLADRHRSAEGAFARGPIPRADYGIQPSSARCCRLASASAAATILRAAAKGSTFFSMNCAADTIHRCT